MWKRLATVISPPLPPLARPVNGHPKGERGPTTRVGTPDMRSVSFGGLQHVPMFL